MKESTFRKIIREEIKAIHEAEVTLPANVKRFMTKFVGALKSSGLNRKRQVAVLGGVVDAMNIEPRKLMMMIKKVKQGINVDENITLKKQQLKGMIRRAKRAGARGYDIILSLSRDLSVSPDVVVSALEKTRLIGMTEWINQSTHRNLNEGRGDIKSQLKLLAKLLKRTGATLKIKGSTITIDLRTGGQEGAMEFQWPRMVKEEW